MLSFLCFTVRFLDMRFHGRADQGQPEWPPSPLRLFQALVAAAAARSNERENLQSAVPALRWLERQKAPVVVAPAAIPARQGSRLYVPDNSGDLIAASWARGGEANIADYRTPKDVRPLYLQADAVHYLYPVDSAHSEFRAHQETLRAATRSITHLGWGIDMVIGDAKILTDSEAAELAGERWFPCVHGAGRALRVPKRGTLDDLLRKHGAFLDRLPLRLPGEPSFQPVSPLSVFALVAYRRTTDPAPRPFAVFKLLQPGTSDYRAFDPVRDTAVVAGMVRHALAQLANTQRPFGWQDAEIGRIVLGHDINGRVTRSEPFEPRFAYLPLPTIALHAPGSYHVGSIRRILVLGMPGMEQEVRWARNALSAGELLREHNPTPVAVLAPAPATEWVVRQYLGPASCWTTVTPVILPGYDDRNAAKTEGLLRKAMRQAGFPPELVDHAELDWRNVGYLPGVDLATRYRRPRNNQEAPTCHVKLTWRDAYGQPLELPGPLVIGSGRFRGLGLFACFRQ